MHFVVHKNIIDSKIRSDIVNLFHNKEQLRDQSMTMDKLNHPWNYNEVRMLESILRQYIDTSQNIGDNIYKHKYPYFPHVDVCDQYPSVNVVIPLYIHKNKPQSFVIFDQYVTMNKPRTWMGSYDFSTKDFEKNKKSKFIHEDNDIKNLTGLPIDDTFYQKYLDVDYFTPDLFFGLTGNAVDYKPGNLIIFDSKYVHCTGKMQAEYKIGLTLRFKGTLK